MMKIGFDAKRIFHNSSGLGNYSRNLLRLLTTYYPENEYHLFTPKTSNRDIDFLEQTIVQTPQSFFDKRFKSLWRSKNITKDLGTKKIDIYHGLSNELPAGISKAGIPSIVTVHDLIIHRYPEWYKPLDVKIYKQKFKSAISESDLIIAISEQTKSDIIEFYGADPNKIKVVYQGCNPKFRINPSDELTSSLKSKYNLPDRFLLYVGTVEPRKNVLQVAKALKKSNNDIPFYIIGRKTTYAEEVKKFIEQENLNSIHLLHDINDEELHAFYHLAHAFIYPSIFEGFGIPILEALCSGTPVISSKGGCFSEAGGKESIYVDPKNTDEILEAINWVFEDDEKRSTMIQRGFEHASLFTDDKIASNIYNIYQELL